jgi:prevent-host-death family protein
LLFAEESRRATVANREAFTVNELTSTKAIRGALSEAINRARYGGQRTLLTVRGVAAAVVIPIADLELLDARAGPAATAPAASGKSA